MPAGAAPGTRRGGRQKGVPNKATIAREAAIASKTKAAGLRMAKEVMSEAMNYFRALASRYAITGSTPDEKKFERYLGKAADVATRPPPNEAPRLQSTTQKGNKEKPISATLNIRFV